MPARLGLLLPLHGRPFAEGEEAGVRTVVREGLADGLWVRDVPVAPVGDADVGQGGDPFADLAHVAASTSVSTLGTASVVLGVRHPLVLARAVVGLSALVARTPGRQLVVGIGTGGKPAMNAELGIAGRGVTAFAGEWRRLRALLDAPCAGAGTELVVPPGWVAPPLHLATSDPRRWEAIEGRAEGWQTFLTTPEDYLTRLEAFTAGRDRPLGTCVRADVTVVDGGGGPQVGERGRIRCSLDALVPLVATWRALPVDHLLLRITGADPLDAWRALRATAGTQPADRASP